MVRLFISIALLLPPAAAAQTVKDFYRGKLIRSFPIYPTCRLRLI